MSPQRFNSSIPTTTTTAIPSVKGGDGLPSSVPIIPCVSLSPVSNRKSVFLYLSYHSPKNLGWRLCRHSSRLVPLPPRHLENPPPIFRRLVCERRLERSLQRRRLSNRRFSPRCCALLRNLRSYKIRSCPQPPVSWTRYSRNSSSRRPHARSFSRRDSSVHRACAHRSCQAAGTSVAVFEFLDGIEEYFYLKPGTRKGLDGVVPRVGDYYYARDSVYGYSVSLVGGYKKMEEREEGGKG